MLAPPDAPDENQRLCALRSLGVLDTRAEERFDRVTRLACRTFGVPIALVSLVDARRQWFKSCQGLEASETPREISFCGHAILGSEIFEVCDASEDDRFADNPLVTGEPHIRFYAGVPLSAPGGSKIGTLCLIDRQPRKLAPDDRELLGDLGRMVEEDLANRAQATTDELTGLSNRRGFFELADHALSMCRRLERPATLLFIDLDGFKGVNDSHGHDEGDRALVNVARILLETFRGSDVIARMGGDEFCVLLTDSGDSKVPIERLERELADWTIRQPYTLGLSVGVADYAPARHASLAELVREADAGMYACKRGRGESRGETLLPSEGSRDLP